MSLPSFAGITKLKMDLEKSAKNVISDPETGRDFPGSRLLEVNFVDKVPLTPSNVPTKFRWNNHNRFGEKCKKSYLRP